MTVSTQIRSDTGRIVGISQTFRGGEKWGKKAKTLEINEMTWHHSFHPTLCLLVHFRDVYVMVDTHLNVVVSVVVQVEDTIDFTVDSDVDVIRVGDAFTQGLTCVFLHLNVVEFPVKERRC